MQLKEYQQRALAEIRSYREHLSAWRKKAEAHPDLEVDFPTSAWEKAGIPSRYAPRKKWPWRALADFLLERADGRRKDVAGCEDHRPRQHHVARFLPCVVFSVLVLLHFSILFP
jgi:hypothetical protein